MQLKILKRWEARSKPPRAASGEGGGGGYSGFHVIGMIKGFLFQDLFR